MGKSACRKIIVFMGLPGSGKSSTGEYLAALPDIHLLETGQILREESEKRTALGRTIAESLRSGRLVPPEKVNELMAQRLRVIREPTIIFDGFPRKKAEIPLLYSLCAEFALKLHAVIIFSISKDTARRRLLGRKRHDDTPEIIRQRMRVYEKETAPVITAMKARFEGLTREIDAGGTIQGTTQQVKEIIYQQDT